MDTWISPSILAADFSRLGQEVEDVLNAGADSIHFDVMDNHYVPNLTIGPPVLSALRKFGISATIDAHLMVSPADRLIGEFIEAGADYVSIHPGTTENLEASLLRIKSEGAKAGIVFNPDEELDLPDSLTEIVDLILIMSVYPGFGGQSFIDKSLDKVEAARTVINGCERPIRLQVDGGIKSSNIGKVAKSGADTFVAGTAIFGTSDYAATIKELKQKVAEVNDA